MHYLDAGPGTTIHEFAHDLLAVSKVIRVRGKFNDINLYVDKDSTEDSLVDQYYDKTQTNKYV